MEWKDLGLGFRVRLYTLPRVKKATWTGGYNLKDGLSFRGVCIGFHSSLGSIVVRVPKP